MTTNEELRDIAIAHQVYLLRYQAQLTRKITEILQKLRPELIRQLSDLEVNWYVDQIDAQLAGIKLSIDSTLDEAGQTLIDDLDALTEYEAEHQEAVAQESTPIPLPWTLPAVALLLASMRSKPFEGKPLAEWISKLKEDFYIRIRDAIRMGVTEGENYAQIIKRVIGSKSLNYTDGILAVNLRQAQAIIATAAAHAANEARQVFYKENEDLIKGVQWVSVLDSRTTPVCQARDGKIYPVDSGPRPPAHIRCRSITTMIVKSWKDLGMRDQPLSVRDSMDGKVPAEETYQTWLSKKSPEFQDEVLGPTRGKLFREGMTLDRFVDASGHEYTLKQLKAKDATIFRQAGIDK